MTACEVRGETEVAEEHANSWLGVIEALYTDNGKENGNYYSILGLHWDHGTTVVYSVYWGLEKKLETTIWGLGFRV